MKFVLLKSRGGDYLAVAENVAWLRSHENGQTKVGVVGGIRSSSPEASRRPPPQSWRGSTAGLSKGSGL